MEYTLGVGTFVVFAVSLAAYAFTAAPTAGWLDSAEFVAASASLGVSHSPGHPLPLLLGRALSLLPCGDLAFRINLSSALAMALAASLLYRVCKALAAFLAPSLPSFGRDLVAAVSAFGFAFSFSAWYQAVRAEVYALEVALLLGTLLGVLRFLLRPGDRRPLYAAGLSLGLALANHHFLSLLVFAPVALVALQLRPPLRSSAVTALLGVLGLGAFLYLPVRAARGPEVNWGDPDRVGRFVWTVSAQAFHKSLSPLTPGERPRAFAEVLQVLAEQATPVVAFLSLLGAYLLLRRASSRRLGVLFSLVVVSSVAGNVWLGFDPDNPDGHGYLLPTLAAMFVLASAGLVLLAVVLDGALSSRRLVVLGPLTALVCVLPPVQLWRNAPAASLRRAEASAAYVGAILDTLPSRALLITSYYETLFQLWASRAVEQARPDIVHLDRSLLTYPGEEAQARARHPELAELIAAPLRAGAKTPLSLLKAEARRRPVAFELHFTLDDSLGAYLLPLGFLATFVADSPSPTMRAEYEARDADRIADLAQALATTAPRDQVGARNMLSWNAYLRAQFYCTLGRFRAGRAAAQILARASDPAAIELQILCGPP